MAGLGGGRKRDREKDQLNSNAKQTPDERPKSANGGKILLFCLKQGKGCKDKLM